jgi:serine/threonine protein kinase
MINSSDSSDSRHQESRSRRYQAIRELGHNRAGGRVTYLASDTTTGQPVVIKQFQFAQSGSSWSGFKTYEREIQMMQKLNHPGIPHYLNSFETSKGFCIVQEYKDAQSLAVPRSFDASQIKQIAVSVLEILLYLQNQTPSIIHRDIKPENILVDDHLNVYLVDFGFARISGGQVAMSTVAAGTFGFMAPEQLYNRELSLATDLYGLGATLICLLAGIKSTAIDTLIDEDGRLAFQSLVPQLSLTFIDWLERMVQPNKKDRYSSAAKALAALQPLHLSSIPEVQLSQSSLEFKATKLGQKLTQTIRIKNSLPNSVKEGILEVAPHPNDPPHTPNSHAWISFNPARFERTQADCKITVNTSELMTAQTYERKIFLHTNSVPEINYSFTIKVRTAPLPKVNNKQLDNFLTWLFVVSLIEAMTFVSNVASVRIAAGVIVFVAGQVFGRRSSWADVKFASLCQGIAGVVLAAKAFSLLTAYLDGDVVNLTTTSVALSVTMLVGLAAIAGIILGTKDSVTMPQTSVWKHLKTEFGTIMAVAILLLTVTLGISLGIGLKLGLLNPFVISTILATGLPLVWIIIYLPKERLRLITKYRKSEQYLIKP